MMLKKQLEDMTDHQGLIVNFDIVVELIVYINTLSFFCYTLCHISDAKQIGKL